jgi:5-methylcytosine-specific restriction protein A
MVPWAGSTRSRRLPNDWGNRRNAVRRRARGQCEAEHHAPGCDGTGSECDHIIAGDDHSLTNLQWLSSACHRAKTLGEATEAKAARSRKRTPPPHPGMAEQPPA